MPQSRREAAQVGPLKIALAPRSPPKLTRLLGSGGLCLTIFAHVCATRPTISSHTKAEAEVASPPEHSPEGVFSAQAQHQPWATGKITQQC